MCVTSHYLTENGTDPYPGWITKPYSLLRPLQAAEDRAISSVRPQPPRDHQGILVTQENETSNIDLSLGHIIIILLC